MEKKEEQREVDHELTRVDYAKTGCLDPAEEAEEHLQCTCSFDPEPVKEETWSMSEVCTTCFAANKRGETGMMGTSFKLKKSTVRLALLGEPSATNFVKLTILDKGTALVRGKMPGARLTEGRPFFQESVSNELPVDQATGEKGAPQWYPVEWDVSEFVGRDAVVTVARYDKEKMMAVDDFEFFDDEAGCLPSCMSIRDGVCNGGDETCFYFEEDVVPYVQVKSSGHAKGTFCRASYGPGSKLGPGILSMGYDYADWTDNDPTVLPLIAEREALVMEHDNKKPEWLRKEKERGKTTDWMMNSSQMKEELAKIDEIYFEKILEQDRKITAQRNLRKDQARNITLVIDDIQLKIAEAYAQQAFTQGAYDSLMTDPAKIREREADADNDGIADLPLEMQTKIAGYTESITSLKEEKFAEQDKLEEFIGDDAGWAGSTLDYLSVRHLPRCMFLEMRGSHFAISLPQEGAVLWAYEPEPSLDNGSVMGTHCVYNTIKPKCVSISKGTMHFVKEMRATCQEEIFEGNCLDQCARFFCSSDYDKDGGGGNVNGKDACGKDDIGVSLDGAKGQDGAMAKSPAAAVAGCARRPRSTRPTVPTAAPRPSTSRTRRTTSTRSTSAPSRACSRRAALPGTCARAHASSRSTATPRLARATATAPASGW